MKIKIKCPKCGNNDTAIVENLPRFSYCGLNMQYWICPECGKELVSYGLRDNAEIIESDEKTKKE